MIDLPPLVLPTLALVAIGVSMCALIDFYYTRKNKKDE